MENENLNVNEEMEVKGTEKMDEYQKLVPTLEEQVKNVTMETMTIDESGNTVSTPVDLGTDIKAVNPETTETTEKSEPEATPEATTEKQLNSKGIVEGGKKGVTNTQMIPALKNAITAKDTEKVLALKENYPEVFSASIRYIGKLKKEIADII